VPDVILPVLDESEAIPWVLAHIPPGFEPIVVDNGSSDGSARIAEGLGAVVIHEPRRGFGAACFAGLRAATAEVVCFMDCDASLDPRELPTVAGPVAAGSADLVIGERVSSAGSWPLHARVANRLLALEVRRRTGLRLRDLGPMRAARRLALLDLPIHDRRFGWPLEMVLRAAAAGWVIEGTPVRYRPRVGRSKVTGTLGGGFRALRDTARAFR
jgi:glycosyltransferase involved in cell wall biosynthesis